MMPPPVNTAEDAAEDALEALQTALAAEHAAIYGYGVAGAHLTDDDRERAAAAFDDCRRHRDLLAGMIAAAGAEPGAAAAAYRLPSPVNTAADARALAARLESGRAAAYARIVETARTADLRRLAADALGVATVRRLAWGAPLPTFPGLAP